MDGANDATDDKDASSNEDYDEEDEDVSGDKFGPPTKFEESKESQSLGNFVPSFQRQKAP